MSGVCGWACGDDMCECRRLVLRRAPDRHCRSLSSGLFERGLQLKQLVGLAGRVHPSNRSIWRVLIACESQPVHREGSANRRRCRKELQPVGEAPRWTARRSRSVVLISESRLSIMRSPVVMFSVRLCESSHMRSVHLPTGKLPGMAEERAPSSSRQLAVREKRSRRTSGERCIRRPNLGKTQACL